MTTAVITALVALVLTTAAFTVPTRQALAWGFFGNRMTLDQQINQLNKCKSLSSEGKYDPTSYDVNTSNLPTTESSHSNTDNNHTSIDSSSNHASAVNQTSTDSSGHSASANSGWYTNNNKNSNDAGNDNNKPSDNNGGYNDNNNNNNKKPSSSSVLCSNKATNLATIG